MGLLIPPNYSRKQSISECVPRICFVVKFGGIVYSLSFHRIKMTSSKKVKRLIMTEWKREGKRLQVSRLSKEDRQSVVMVHYV